MILIFTDEAAYTAAQSALNNLPSEDPNGLVLGEPRVHPSNGTCLVDHPFTETQLAIMHNALGATFTMATSITEDWTPVEPDRVLPVVPEVPADEGNTPPPPGPEMG